VLRKLETREEKGIVSPLFAIEYALEDLNDFIEVKLSENVLYMNLEYKLKELEVIDAPQRD
jgi:hypothetical protein